MSNSLQECHAQFLHREALLSFLFIIIALLSLQYYGPGSSTGSGGFPRITRFKFGWCLSALSPLAIRLHELLRKFRFQINLLSLHYPSTFKNVPYPHLNQKYLRFFKLYIRKILIYSFQIETMLKSLFQYPQQFAAIPGYTVPATVHQTDLICSPTSQNENIQQLKSKNLMKGNAFAKSPKAHLKIQSTPSPTLYQSVITEIPKMRLPKYVGFGSKEYKKSGASASKQKPCDEQYKYVQGHNAEENDIRTKKSCPKWKMDKGQRITFIDHQKYASSKLPGPGEYQQKRELSKKSGKIMRSASEGTLQKRNSKNKNICETSPASYIIPRNHSVSCNALMRDRCTDKDQSLKKALKRKEKERKIVNRVGPGKYLNISEWCIYKSNQRIQNVFTVESKPKIRIYS